MIELQKLQNDFESVLVHSQDYPFYLDSKNLIEQWAEAKKDIINLFGGELILRSKEPIKIFLTEEQKNKRFEEFIQALDENGILTTDLELFLRDNKRGFFDNRVLLPYPSFNIPLGSKLSKSFKRFINSQEIVRWAQDTASRYMQENKIEGYLYLSIHPLDFLTVSENNENWWSCQSLDGDYRSGNLSYLVDKTTIVAYLSNGKQEHLKCLPLGMKWNSKKWRMLVHTDGIRNIYYNRQYPYESRDLLACVHNMLLKLIKFDMSLPLDYGFKVIQTQWGSEQLIYNQINAGGRIHDTRDVIDMSDYLGYSDLVISSTYAPIISVNNGKYEDYTKHLDQNKYVEELYFNDVFQIKIGERPICPCCGTEHINREDSFLCNFCISEKEADEDFFLTCNSCYRRIYDEDKIYWMDGRPYCKTCHNLMKQEDRLIEEDDE